MNLRRWVANLMIRTAHWLDPPPDVPNVVTDPRPSWEIDDEAEKCRVLGQHVDLRHQGVLSTTMWTKLNSSSGNFVRGGPRVLWRSRR